MRKYLSEGAFKNNISKKVAPIGHPLTLDIDVQTTGDDNVSGSETRNQVGGCDVLREVQLGIALGFIGNGNVRSGSRTAVMPLAASLGLRGSWVRPS